ncbi:hypothetical protein [Cryobacterium sp. SO1]|uniref:beta family protein n=1 Tax=Cryobacterium sp. SO1 TaxID=1897061 RepID=UPI0010238212|nr:hypothetical protein [Cryobacterium sp. SO1]
MQHYRPFILARRGELSAISKLSPAARSAFTPVLVVPGRSWDFESDEYAKSLSEHFESFPKKYRDSLGSAVAFVDVSLLDSDESIFGGVDPLTWIVEESNVLGLELVPLVTPFSASSALGAVRKLHQKYGRGVGIRIAPEEWVSLDDTHLERLLAATGLSPQDVDLFIDCGSTFGPLVQRSLLTELAELDSRYLFRSARCQAVWSHLG